MIIKTEGIVLRTLKYRENSLIADVFTSELGLRTYLINGVHSKKGSSLLAYFQPLNLLDLVVYEKDEQKMQRIKEMHLAYYPQSPLFDPVKTGLLLFASEVLRMILMERAASPDLYSKTKQLIIEMQETSESLALFPQYFLLSLTSELGIQPQGEFDDRHTYFDLREGQFGYRNPEHLDTMSEEVSRLTSAYLRLGPVYKFTAVSKPLRLQWLHDLLRYYEIHVSQFKSLKTLPVLAQILQQH